MFSTKSNKISCPFLANSFPSSTVKSANSLMSAPATNAFSPEPVIITAPVFALLFAAVNAEFNSLIVSLFRAFS